MLVVARAEDARTGRLKPCLFVVPTDAEGFEFTPIHDGDRQPREAVHVFIDDVRLPADALVGDEDAGIAQLFAGLNPERIMAASFSTGLARFALDKATAYVKEPGGLRRPDRRPPGRRAPAGAVQDRDRAGPADDPEGRRALRRRRRHGAPARRRTWRSTPPPRPPATPPTGPSRRTAATASPQEYGVAGLLVAARADPDRPGQPRDDPELRGHALPGPAQVLLTADGRRTTVVGQRVPASHCRRGLLMTDAPAELVHYRVDDHVASLVLDSQHNRNALSAAAGRRAVRRPGARRGRRRRQGRADPRRGPHVLLRRRPVRGQRRRHGAGRRA